MIMYLCLKDDLDRKRIIIHKRAPSPLNLEHL